MADLTAACEKSGELRQNPPRFARQVLDRLGSIRESLESPRPEHLPSRELKILKEKLDGLVAVIEEHYPEDEDEFKLGSEVYYRVIDLDATLNALRRHVVESEDYKDFLQCLRRIDSVLPSADYDFKDLFRHISKDKPTEKIYRRLKESVDEFGSGRFEECLNKAEKLNEALIENMKEYTQTVFKCQVDSLGGCRKELQDATPDPDCRSRLEFLVVYLLEISRFLRNLVAHDAKQPKIPAWMDERRGWLRHNSVSARLMILCELHAALELQHLWQNEAPPGAIETQSSTPGVEQSGPA